MEKTFTKHDIQPQCIIGQMSGGNDHERMMIHAADRQQLGAQFIANSTNNVPQYEHDLIRLRTQDYCSFDVRCHPQHASLEEKCRAWMTELFQAHGLPPSQLRRVLDIHYDRLTCMMYPDGASEARSFTLVKLIHWIFLLDDLVDDPRHLGLDLAAALAFCSRLFLSMFGPSCAAAAGFITTLDDIADELKGIPIEQLSQQNLVIEVGTQWSGEMQAQGISPQQYKRMQAAVVDYVTGILDVVALRGDNRLPSLEEYNVLRRKDGASDIGIFGCEFGLDMELDNETLAHPLIQDLHQASADQLNWINDVLSFDSEYQEGDYINLVTILHYQSNQMPPHAAHKMHDFQGALSQACSMIKAKDKEGGHLSREISEWNPSLQCYVQAIHHAISGITAWTLGNLRYRKGGAMVSTN